MSSLKSEGIIEDCEITSVKPNELNDYLYESNNKPLSTFNVWCLC